MSKRTDFPLHWLRTCRRTEHSRKGEGSTLLPSILTTWTMGVPFCSRRNLPSCCGNKPSFRLSSGLAKVSRSILMDHPSELLLRSYNILDGSPTSVFLYHLILMISRPFRKPSSSIPFSTSNPASTNLFIKPSIHAFSSSDQNPM